MGPTALLPLRRKCVLRIFITHKNPPPSVGFEPATECPVGPVASTLTTRPPRATVMYHFCTKVPRLRSPSDQTRERKEKWPGTARKKLNSSCAHRSPDTAYHSHTSYVFLITFTHTSLTFLSNVATICNHRSVTTFGQHTLMDFLQFSEQIIIISLTVNQAIFQLGSGVFSWR
jgi:hypothetical protein